MADERAAFAGQITDLPVAELFRTILSGRQTGVARFETNLGSATVWFREGTLIDADMGRFHMGDAVRRLISTDAGSFEVELKPVTRRRLIKEETAHLIESDGSDAAPALAAEPAPDASAGPKRGLRRGRGVAGWQPTAGGAGNSDDPPAGAKSSPRGAASPDMLRRLEALRRSADRQPPSAAVASSTSRLTPRNMRPSGQRGTAETPQASLEALNRDVGGAPVAAEVAGVAEKPAAAPAPRPAAAPRTSAAKTPAPKPTATPAPRRDGPRKTAFGIPASDVSAPPPPASSPARVKHGTSSGLPVQGGDAPASPAAPAAKAPVAASGWKFIDKSLPDFSASEEEDAADKTLFRAGPLPVARPAVKRPGGRRAGRAAVPEAGEPQRVDPQEDLSDPLPIGTSWSAPAHVSTPRSNPIDSERSSSAGGEIGRDAAPEKRVLNLEPRPPNAPPQDPSPNATMTHGFRPITDAEGPQPLPGRPNTDSYRPVEDAARASGIAAAIGLQTDAPTQPAGGGSSGPALVGRYEVLLRIARGGMGTVYLCQVTGAGGFRRLFALKVIRDHLSRNDDYVRMMLQEARIASRLHHPNVVGIVDIGNLANQHYLVMDYVEGCTLSELLKVHRKTRPAHLIIPILLDALTGLHAAHTLTDDDGSPLTLVHCDFSPQNMLLGTNGICRITDFGIARASKALPERASITRGKPAYLSPEQITGRPFDHRADIFSAGVVLWNALTGEQLFAGESPEDVLDKVLSKPIPPPSSVGLRPSKRLDKVVLRALQRDPDKRYQTAEDMLIDLRKVAIAEDLLAPSSDVAKWVTDTFGTQLELRRRAAGLAPKSGPAAGISAPSESTALAIPELGASSDESATHAILSNADDGSASHTMMLRGGSSSEDDSHIVAAKPRKFLLAGAVALAGGLLAVAVVRPDLLMGGLVDEHGSYYEIAPQSDDDPLADAVPKDGKTPEGKTPPAEIDPSAPAAVDPDPPTPAPRKPRGAKPKPAATPAAKPKPDPTPKSDPKAAPKPDPKPDPKPAPKPKADPKPAEPDLPEAPNLKELLDPPM